MKNQNEKTYTKKEIIDHLLTAAKMLHQTETQYAQEYEDYDLQYHKDISMIRATILREADNVLHL